MVEVDPYALGGVLIVLIIAIVGAAVYISKLSSRITQLENNPILKIFNDIANENLITLFSNRISNSKVEKKDD